MSDTEQPVEERRSEERRDEKDVNDDRPPRDGSEEGREGGVREDRRERSEDRGGSEERRPRSRSRSGDRRRERSRSGDRRRERSRSGGRRPGGDRGDREEGGESTSVMVRNLPFDITTDELREDFSYYGRVRDVYIPRDFNTRRPRGFAFIEFLDDRDANDAVRDMDKRQRYGREIAVSIAQERRKKPHEMRRPPRGSDDRDRGSDRGGRGYDRDRRRSRSRSRDRRY